MAMMPINHVTCPACGSPDVEWVSDGDVTNFLCRACWRCWHPELGWVRRVDPRTCPGCGHRDQCLAIEQMDDPTTEVPMPSHPDNPKRVAKKAAAD